MPAGDPRVGETWELTADRSQTAAVLLVNDHQVVVNWKGDFLTLPLEDFLRRADTPRSPWLHPDATRAWFGVAGDGSLVLSSASVLQPNDAAVMNGWRAIVQCDIEPRLGTIIAMIL